MTHDISEVKLWIREEGTQSPRRLLNTITSTSKFKTMPWFNRLNDCNDGHLIRAAKDQRDGWKFNGPYPNAKFEIEAFDHRGNEVVI